MATRKVRWHCGPLPTLPRIKRSGELARRDGFHIPHRAPIEIPFVNTRRRPASGTETRARIDEAVAADYAEAWILLPMASVTDISTISRELLAKFQTNANPVDAVFKTMGGDEITSRRTWRRERRAGR